MKVKSFTLTDSNASVAMEALAASISSYLPFGDAKYTVSHCLIMDTPKGGYTATAIVCVDDDMS